MPENNSTKQQEQKFYNKVKIIEGSKEDDSVTSLLFDSLTNLERINAFFTLIAIISSLFAYEFKNKIEYYSEDNSKILESLHNAQDACLAIVTGSVVFFSKIK